MVIPAPDFRRRDDLSFLLRYSSKCLEFKGKAISCHLLEKMKAFDTIFQGEHFMLYELIMLWIVGSITVVVSSMVLGGLLCVWCAFIGRRRAARLVANCARPLSHP